jgi:hypothetical protein
MDVLDFPQRWAAQMFEKRSGFYLVGLGFGMGYGDQQMLGLLTGLAAQDFESIYHIKQ